MSHPPPPPEFNRVIAAFPLPGQVLSTTPYGNGHINETFVTVVDVGRGTRRFIFQKINHRIFKRVPELMENITRVTAHLRTKQPRGLALVSARDGRDFFFVNGSWWRVYDFIEDSHSVETITQVPQAREAARAFGEFQAMLADLPGGRLHDTIPNFHHTRGRFEALRRAADADKQKRAADAKPEIDFAFAREADSDVLLVLLARGEITERVTHNDTKINNLMFDNTTGRAVAVLDLDTVMPGLALYDFGDMVRTAASSTAEDDPEPARMKIVLPYFRALVTGYLESAGEVLNATERAHLGFSAKLMAYEVGLRFLTDHLEGDTYFSIKRPRHNLERARTQFALVRSREENFKEMNRIVAEVEKTGK